MRAALNAEATARLILLSQLDTCLAMSASPAAVTQQEWDRMRTLRDAYQTAFDRLTEATKRQGAAAPD